MKSLHLVTGVLMLIFFAATGHYMKHSLHLPDSEFTTQRMMFRASHIYLLFAGCVNVLAGCYWGKIDTKYLSYLQVAGSVLLLGSQILLVSAFIFEPSVLSLKRPFTFYGCASMLLGVILTLIATSLSPQNKNQ